MNIVMVFQLKSAEKENNRRIPDLVDYIAGDFSSSIWAIWARGNLSEYLMATTAQRHVWHAVLAASKSDLSPLSEMREWLIESKSKDLLAKAFGTCPAGMVRLLSKLGPRAESAEFYREVHAALNRNDVLSRILQHARTIDPQLVSQIAYLPTDKLTVHMASHALRHNVRDIDLKELSWLCRRIAKFDQSGEILAAISRSGNPLLTVRKAIVNLPFPDAPWTVQHLKSISSVGELCRVAKQMDNCLVDHDQLYSSCIEVQSGIAYYFETLGNDHLLVKFSKFSALGWYLDECRGYQNRRPTIEEIGNITEALYHLDNVWCRRLNYKLR